MRGEVKTERRTIFRQRCRLGIEHDFRASPYPIEPAVTQCHETVAQFNALDPTLTTNEAAYLEDIGKIAVKQDRKSEWNGSRSEIVQRQSLMERLVGEKQGACDVQSIYQHDRTAIEEIRIREDQPQTQLSLDTFDPSSSGETPLMSN